MVKYQQGGVNSRTHKKRFNSLASRALKRIVIRFSVWKGI